MRKNTSITNEGTFPTDTLRLSQGGEGETPVLRSTGGVQAEYSGVRVEYKWSTSGVNWSTSGVQWSTSGVREVRVEYWNTGVSPFPPWFELIFCP